MGSTVLMTLWFIGIGMSVLSMLLTLISCISREISYESKNMTEGSAKSFAVVFEIVVFLIKIPFMLLGFVAKGIIAGGRGIASGCKWVHGRFTQQREKLIDFDIRRLESDYRKDLRWSIVVEGKTYHIRSLDDLPEKYRNTVRMQFILQGQGMCDILKRTMDARVHEEPKFADDGYGQNHPIDSRPYLDRQGDEEPWDRYDIDPTRVGIKDGRMFTHPSHEPSNDSGGSDVGGSGPGGSYMDDFGYKHSNW